MMRLVSRSAMGARRSRLPAAYSIGQFNEVESRTENNESRCHFKQETISYFDTNQFQKRFMSSDANPPKQNFDETMDKLFHESQKEAQSEGDAWFLDEAAEAAAFEPSWWNLADHAVNGVQFVHEMSGLHYAGSIVAATMLLRFAILPVAVNAQRAASRMAHLQPELKTMKDRYEALGTPSQAEQKAFADQMKGLFNRYEVKPFAAFAAPLLQAPLFIGMFFGMKKMPDIFADQMSTGGILWFTDLTVPDPTYVLPLICGVSFLTTIEAGKDQMIDSNPQYGPVMVNAFRAMAVVMVPVITTFPAAMLCYWVPNNFFTLVQSVTLRNEFVRKQLGIWDRPKPIPGTSTDAGFQETMQNLMKKAQGEPTTEAEMLQRHNEEIETKKRVKQMSRATKASRRNRK
ncbi:MAG: hypothetical protein SGBAC_001937 [Bacillariaceae sp.]